MAFIVNGKIVANGSMHELMESVSHGHTIRLVTDICAENLAPDLQARFAGSTVEMTRDHALVLKSEERIPLLPVMEYFDRGGIVVYEARELKPTLEDVFVRLTGLEAAKLKKEKEKGGNAS